MSSTARPRPRRCCTSAARIFTPVWSLTMATRRISAFGARSAGIAASTEPAGTTVTRRSRSVSAASGVTCPPFASSTVAPRSIVRASASVMIWYTFTLIGYRLSAIGYRTSDLAPSLPQNRDIRKVAVLLRVVEAVPDDEVILDREPDVVHLDLDFPARRLAEQARRLQRLRRACLQQVLQVMQRQAGVDDVLDENDVAA